MSRRSLSVVFSLILILSMVSLTSGFDNNANRVNPDDPNDTRQRPYTRENAVKPLGEGGYFGGHDTITAEGMLLKKKVHQQTDLDGGEDFKEWADELALPFLRIGVHDEDSTKLFGIIPLNESPIVKGENGNYFQHFYDPRDEKGLKGVWKSALQRAGEYALEIYKIIGCSPDGVSGLSNEEKSKVYRLFGHILHLIEDMGNPAHTKDDIHVFTKTFEDYVKEHWADIVNSDAFKEGVTVDEYLKGNYEVGDIYNLKQFFVGLANTSMSLHTDYLGKITDEQLQENVDRLIPETIKYVAGYIDAIYKEMNRGGSLSRRDTGHWILLASLESDVYTLAQLIGDTENEEGFTCDLPPEQPTPANDNPDDRFDVSDEFYWEKEFGLTDYDLTNFYMRTAVKKGKISVWYKKRFMDMFIEGRTKYMDAPLEVKEAIEAEFQAIGKKLEERDARVDWEGAPDIALFTNGYYKPSISLMLKIGEPVAFKGWDFDPAMVKDHPVMLVPTGGFYGMENSEVLKAKLGEYVKNGGTLVVFTQQHGSDWSLLPTPPDPETGEKRPVTGYGYQEDQSCQYNSVYIDTWHPMLSGFSTSTANIGVDGYFTSYPENSTILLRRVANGQPAMIIYPYGKGYVVATTLYTDFAFTHSQANQTEIKLAQNIISWAKKPDTITEVTRGETVNLNISLSNFTDKDATSVKFIILDPLRKVVGEQTQEIAIPAGKTVTIPYSYTVSSTSPLGIYHVDYALLDAAGNVIQPQAETDSGRFAVSNPPLNPYESPDFDFAIQSDAEQYAYGSTAVFTVKAWNNTNKDTPLTFKYDLVHLGPDGSWIKGKTYDFNAPANASISFNIVIPEVKHQGWLRGWFYDESGNTVGFARKGIWVFSPSVSIDAQTNQAVYKKGDTVNLTLSLQNRQNAAYTAVLKVNVSDPLNRSVYDTTLDVALAANETVMESLSFLLPQTAEGGFYIVSVEAYDSAGRKIGRDSVSFELPRSRISAIPDLSVAFSAGTNTISFILNNNGKISVSSGVLDVNLIDPEGAVIYSGSLPFALTVGESKTIDVPVTISSLKFGDYTLTYTQSDETKTGKPISVIIPNSVAIGFSFDKTFYRIREVVGLTVGVTNTGRFNLDGVSVMVSVPDAGYTDSTIISLGINNTISLDCAIPLPETLAAGQHNIDVTLLLPSGSSITQTSEFTIPESSLVIGYSGPTTVTTGDVINLTMENTGGVDTNYTAEELYIIDNKGVVIYNGSATDTILAGEIKTLADIHISSQAASSLAFLNVLTRDSETGRFTAFSRTLEITGLTAELQTRTDKDAYLKTEVITGISNVINGQFGIVNGILNVTVSKMETHRTGGQFDHFLPKEGWLPLDYVSGIAIGSDGSIYVLNLEISYDRVLKLDSNGRVIISWGSYGRSDGQFYSPDGIAVGPDGSVYVADTHNQRIQKFDSNGNFITKWGSYGSGDGQFKYPRSVAVSPDGAVYVVDSSNHRIQKFDSNGNFITKWGSYGSGDGQFKYPDGIAVGSDGSVYVVDTNNHRIQKFDSNGNFITKWGSYGSGDGQFRYPDGMTISSDGLIYVVDSSNYRIQKFNSNGNFITKWGSRGSGDGQFRYPSGIAVDHDGFVYVGSSSLSRIQKFDGNGNFITKWQGEGSDDGQFNFPEGIAAGPDGSVYVADTYNHRIQKFNSNGDFITKWGDIGHGDGQFYYPEGIAVGSDGTVYVADTDNNRIQKFDSSGNFITKWGSYGSGEGQFCHPRGIAIDPEGAVYVADTCNNRIQKFDSNGNFITKWGSYGSGEGQFCYPWDIAVDLEGSVYVTDTCNNRIQKFDSSGNFITKWGSYGSGKGQFCYPGGIAAGSDSSVYVVDTYNYRVQRFDSSGNFIAKWGSYGDSDGRFRLPRGIAVSPAGSVYVVDLNSHRIQKMAISNGASGILFETTVPITQAANTAQEYITDIGTLNTTGKLYLNAELKNDLGQTIAKDKYSFYIIEGNTFLIFSTDKKYYRPGETVTIVGEVRNLASITATELTLILNQDSQALYSATFDLPAGGSYSFTTTTTASAKGTYVLTGVVMQGNSALVEITDQYEVAKPVVTAAVTAPEVVGNEPFDINIEIKNDGKVDAAVMLQSSIDNQVQDITIPAGETRVLGYSRQIIASTTYTFMFTGDLVQTLTKTVNYGLGASIAVSPQTVYPEGGVEIPVTLMNTGTLGESLTVEFSLAPMGLIESRTYYIPAGASMTDILYYELTEGEYTISATSQLPDAFAQANFSVKKENNVRMDVSISTQAGGLIPVRVDLTNLGYNSIDGNLRYVLVDSSGADAWSGEQEVTALLPDEVRAVTFDINPQAITPGDYVLNVSLLENSGQTIASESAPLSILGPVFEITQLPPYQTYQPGQAGEMTFSVKNTGNLEGEVEFSLSMYDLIDSSQRAWLAAGEEKTFTFRFALPDDLEEKDYFADYSLTDGDGNLITSGQVKYHLAGINIAVDASLDKQNYLEGETAHLTLNVQSQTGVSLPLFARVNYAGYESEQAFTLSGSQALTFDVPLTQITGEKLFYGIYHESGRSIHLNSLYIHRAGDVLTITTDKQVYNPGEVVVVTVLGGQSGTLAINALDYTNTIMFTGSIIDSFTLPAEMTAGTYTITATLTTDTGETFTETHPFDVAGIQVKVLECVNDKGKYAMSDTIITRYTISSNTDIPATLKTWIVDPEGGYTLIGEKSISLSSTENLLFTDQTPFVTDTAGIHRLVYGIYKDGLLLVSGSEAFDVGDAVLLGISTDKTDYSTNTEPVVVTVNAFGTVDASLEIQIDENTIKTQQLSLEGFVNTDIDLGTIEPGVHTLKGILTVGGLKSTKETSFVYGSTLPDLTVRGYQARDIDSNNTLAFKFTVANQGKTLADATSLAFYEGTNLVETQPVKALNPDESEEITLTLNVLGKAGTLVLKAVADAENAVAEFNEKNNTEILSVEIPEITLFTTTGRGKYRINEDVDITAHVTNLSMDALNDYSIRTTVSSVSGTVIFDETITLGILQAISSQSIPFYWNISPEIEEGSYRIDQYVLNPSGEIVASSSAIIEVVASDFSIVFDVESIRVKQGEKAVYTGTIEPLGYFDASVTLTVAEPPEGATLTITPDTLVPPGIITLEIFTNEGTKAGTHQVKIIASGDGIVHESVLTLDVAAFTMETDSNVTELEQLKTAIFNITLDSINGYEGEVTLGVDGVPFGVKASFSQSTVQVPGAVTLNIQTSKYVIPGTYKLTVTGDDGLVKHRLDFTINLQLNPEIADGIITAEGPGPNNEAWIRVFNSDLEPVLELIAFDTKYGAYATSADIDGDGYDEVVVSQGPDPKNKAVLRIFKKDGVFIKEFTVFDTKYGLTLSSGDLNGDWIDEIVVGMGPDPKNPAIMKVLRYNGSELDEMAIQTVYEGMKYGVNTAVGDIDGDNVPEIITAPGPGPNNPALIKIWKQDEQHLWESSSFNAFEGNYGANVATGDIDGDGISEIIVGAGPDPKNVPMVRVFKSDGSAVLELTPYSAKYGYGVNVASIDIDGDGVAEIVTGLGSAPQNPAWVKVFKSDGSEVASFLAYPNKTKYGVRLFLGKAEKGR
jgi:DNA-binding beta-propeller fold protein YncE